MAAKSTLKGPQSPASASNEATPTPRQRLPLKTLYDVKAEMARLYREGRSGTRCVQDVSRLANVLGLLGRLIETSELETRLQKLEADE